MNHPRSSPNPPVETGAGAHLETLDMVNLDTPTEVRQFEKGRFEVYHVGSAVLGRATYEPGWRWSEHVGPTVASASCQVEHVGLVLSGQAVARMDDGTERLMKAGDLFYVPAGHDSWVIGDEPYVSFHIVGSEGYVVPAEHVTAVNIRSADEIRDLVATAFDEHRIAVLALVPDSEVEHVGATAVPGALTKGDVDLLVRVGERDFAAAVEALSRRYAIHQRHNWTPALASFKAPDTAGLEVGIQLVVEGSDADGFFGPFRDALINRPALLTEYNGLKRRLDGLDYEHYTEQKGAFIERVLRDLNARAR